MSVPQLYKATGIILKRNNVGEGDKIISVLVEHLGKKRFVAKGIRKINSRRASHVELFAKTEFIIHKGKTLDYISGANSLHLYGSSYLDLKQIAASYTACELIDRLIMEGQVHDQVFYIFDRLLADLETGDLSAIPKRLKLFIDNLLAELGYRTKESESVSLGNAIAAVERVIERKVRSVNLLSKSGIELFERDAR